MVECLLGLVEMLQNRQAQHDVERLALHVWEHALDPTGSDLHLGMAGEVVGQGEIDEQHALDAGKYAPRKAGVVAAAEVSHPLPVEAGVSLDRARAQPDAEAVDEREVAALPEGLLAYLRAGRAHSALPSAASAMLASIESRSASIEL